MSPIQPTIVLTTQVPTLRVLPSMGINFSVASGAGDGGDTGSDRAQQAGDDIPIDHGAEPSEDPKGDGSGDCDNDVITVSSPVHRAMRCSVTPLSTGGHDVDVGSTSGGMATDLSRIGGGSKASSPHLFSLDRLKLTPSMSTATAQMLIQSTHELLDHPNKTLQKTADLSDDKGILEHTASFDNEGQVTSPQKDKAEEEVVDLLSDPGDLATQTQREAAVAKIRLSVWAEDAADVKRIKQKQMPLGQVSNRLVFQLFDPKLVLENILDLIVLRLSPEVFIDHCTTAAYKPNLDLLHIKHMYLKFKYVYVIQLCHTSTDFSTPQLFTRVPTPHTVKKHTIPGVMAKSKEYKAVLCNFCPSFCGNEDSAYNHVCHLHLCMAVECGQCFEIVSFSLADFRDHFRNCSAEGFDSGLAARLD